MNIFEAINKYGHDEDYKPVAAEFPTDAPPGSPEKIEIIRRRVELGQEVSHPLDRTTYEGTEPGCVRAKESTCPPRDVTVVPFPKFATYRQD